MYIEITCNVRIYKKTNEQHDIEDEIYMYKEICMFFPMEIYAIKVHF